MRRKRIRIAALALAATGVLISSAAAAPTSATLTIRHQVKGCHTWAFTGGAWKATQTITLARGAKLTVIDNDVMPHTLYQLSGPRPKFARPAMRQMSARATAVFSKAGRYVLGTKAGEDYPNMKGMETVGEDNVLRLIVTVR